MWCSGFNACRSSGAAGQRWDSTSDRSDCAAPPRHQMSIRSVDALLPPQGGLKDGSRPRRPDLDLLLTVRLRTRGSSPSPRTVGHSNGDPVRTLLGSFGMLGSITRSLQQLLRQEKGEPDSSHFQFQLLNHAPSDSIVRGNQSGKGSTLLDPPEATQLKPQGLPQTDEPRFRTDVTPPNTMGGTQRQYGPPWAPVVRSPVGHPRVDLPTDTDFASSAIRPEDASGAHPTFLVCHRKNTGSSRSQPFGRDQRRRV